MTRHLIVLLRQTLVNICPMISIGLSSQHMAEGNHPDGLSDDREGINKPSLGWCFFLLLEVPLVSTEAFISGTSLGSSFTSKCLSPSATTGGATFHLGGKTSLA